MSPAADEPTLSLPEAATMVGRYRLVKFLGSGGFGDVHLAFDTVLKREVALKLLRARGGVDSERLTRRAIREARAAAGTSHANAVVVYDTGEAEGQPFIAMELVSGESLSALIEAHRGTLAERVRWIRDLAAALAAAHGAGLVHRDVKPSNVKVRADGTVKLIDFGIAAQTVEEERDAPWSVATQGAELMGTPTYMAPEALAGAQPDPRSDQFAWGLVAYEVVSGKHARASTADARSRFDAYAVPLPLCEVRRDVPVSLSNIVGRALALPPQDRFETMADVVEGLSRWLDAWATESRGSSPANTPARRRDPTEARDYSPEEADAILGRASDKVGQDAQRIDHESLIEAAGEAGIPREAVEAAAEEIRRGVSLPEKKPANRSRVFLSVSIVAVAVFSVGALVFWIRGGTGSVDPPDAGTTVGKPNEPPLRTKLPAGTYPRSCKPCSVSAKEDLLSCACKKVDGSVIPAVLRDLDRCTKEITNCNGSLICGGCSDGP
jgi:serine/threonine protein kinase